MGRHDRWTDFDVALHYAKLGRPQPGAQVTVPESTLQARVRRLALDYGWLYFHDQDSRKNDAGMLDTVLAKPGHPLYLWELKRQEVMKPTEEQHNWLSVLGHVTGVESALYRPSDWSTIVDLLTRPPR